MRIASFNINGIKARLPRLKEWLEETRPTVACLQEIKTMDESFPGDEFEAIGYKAIWHGQKGFNGVAILADGVEPKEIQRGLGIDGPKEGEGEQARYLEAEVNGVRICNLYLPNGNPHPGPKFDYKLAWMERLTAHARRLLETEDAIVLGGDYNICPTDDDVYNPAGFADDALCRPESRGRFRRLMYLGLTDAFRAFNTAPHLYSYWDYQRGAWPKDEGLRIDHLLLSPQAADRLKDCGVDKTPRGKEKPSDHTPVWCELAD